MIGTIYYESNKSTVFTPNIHLSDYLYTRWAIFFVWEGEGLAVCSSLDFVKFWSVSQKNELYSIEKL